MSVISLIIYVIKFLGDHFIRKKSDFFNRKNRMSINDNYNNALNEFVTNIRLIKSFGMEFFEVEKMQELKLKVSKPFGSKDNFLLKLLMFINQFGDTIILFIAGKKTLKGEMSYGDLSLFQNYFRQLQMTFNRIQTEYQNYQDFFENWKRFFEVYDYQPKIVNNDVNIKPDEIEGKIRSELNETDHSIVVVNGAGSANGTDTVNESLSLSGLTLYFSMESMISSKPCFVSPCLT